MAAQPGTPVAAPSAPPRHLRVVVFFHSLAYVRFFDGVLRLMLERGHDVELVIERTGHDPSEEAWLAEMEQSPRFGFRRTKALRTDRWQRVARPLRAFVDYVRFLDPAFRQAPYLVARAEARAPARLRGLLGPLLGRSPRSRRIALASLRALERALPVPAGITALFRDLRPDVVVVCPHLMPGSRHSEYVRGARSLDIPTVLAVASWDNLSSKQALHELPDAVFVWNEIQRDEAVRLHDVPPERVVVTGAQSFDHWFTFAPRPRGEFCARLGLDPARPYVLYLGGSLFPGELTEAEWARRWAEALRARPEAALRDAGVVLRPHPKRSEEWERTAFGDLRDVVVWPPRHREMPIGAAARADYFDSIHHSAAVVGLNTSAMIETAIVGRTVHTVFAPEFASSQRGVFHFEYLLAAGGGAVRAADTLDEHFRQLADAVAGKEDRARERLAFVRSFVRPRGLETAATPVFVDEVERVARR